MKKPEFMIATDVLSEHLYHPGESPSYLELMLIKGLCFTTALNAAELIHSSPLKEAAADVLNAVKVLGIHPKYTLKTDKYAGSVSWSDALFLSAAEMNKLPVVTLNTAKYTSAGVKVYHPEEV